MKSLFFFMLTLGTVHHTFGSRDTTGFFVFQQQEQRLSPLSRQFISGKTDAVRRAAALKVYEELGAALASPNSWNYPFDSLRQAAVSVIAASDGLCRLFTWNLILKDGKHLYFGYVQYKIKKEWKLESLLDTARNKIPDLEYAETDASRWPGALYYTIEPFRFKKRNYYLLLGYDGADARTNRKILDVLNLNQGDGVLFGLPVFRRKEGDFEPKLRWVTEAAEQAVISFRYEPARNIIVLSELAKAFENSPDDPSFMVPSGDYHYFSRDNKGYWVFHPLLTDFDFRRKR
jgi:hypothetical protein